MKKKLTFLDLTNRLPGPLALSLIDQELVDIIKVEDKNYPDPFNTSFYEMMDKSFKDWYQEINKNKKIITLDFKNENDLNHLQEMIIKSDLIVSNFPQKILKKFYLPNVDTPLIKIESSKNKTHYHDLNMQAEIGFLKKTYEFLGINSKNNFVGIPLPILGISFSQSISRIALEFLLMIENKIINKNVKTIFFVEEINKVYHLFLNSVPSKTFSNMYPCYCIYPMKDNQNFLVCGCIEEHFWINFCEDFKLNLTIEDRFNQEKISYIAEIVSKMDIVKIKEILSDKNYCVNIF